MKWQPIETAPRDGTRILTYEVLKPDPSDPEDDELDTMVICYWLENEEFGDGWREDFSGYRCYPTHWMPLPEKPE